MAIRKKAKTFSKRATQSKGDILNAVNGKIYIAITVVDDAQIQKLNKDFRSKDYATDVLSFRIDEKMEDGTNYLGDVVINRDQAERQAKEYSNSLEEEIAELAGHGILHLLGVHHDGDDH